MKNSMIALSLLLNLAPRVSAIELSLEENKAERGNIGYIDMQRLFKTFPETLRAKENFEELVRQAEDQLNLRKVELLRLRNDLSQLKIQRDFVSKTPIEVPAKAAAKAPEKPKASEPKPAEPNPAVDRLLRSDRSVEPVGEPASENEQLAPRDRRAQEPETDLTRPSIASLPGFSAPASTQTSTAATAPRQEPEQPKAKEPLAINIPGVSTSTIIVQPPEPAPPPAAVATTTTPALNPALVELDAKIAVKTNELATRESDFKQEQAAAERNLLDMESRKTEVLLGKIHRAVQDVARREGISVVVDKNSILYGHDAVDLTDKVMRALKGS